MDREQLAAFLAVAQTKEPRHFPLFFTLSRTGLRFGEAAALRWEDLDYGGCTLRVERSLSEGGIGSTKTGRVRTVDMSASLRDLLRRLEVERKAETLKRGWGEVPPWVFCTTAGTLLDRAAVDKAFKRTLKAAKLPRHFTPHCLRHTFASLLLQQGECVFRPIVITDSGRT